MRPIISWRTYIFKIKVIVWWISIPDIIIIISNKIKFCILRKSIPRNCLICWGRPKWYISWWIVWLCIFDPISIILIISKRCILCWSYKSIFKKYCKFSDRSKYSTRLSFLIKNIHQIQIYRSIKLNYLFHRLTERYIYRLISFRCGFVSFSW